MNRNEKAAICILIVLIDDLLHLQQIACRISRTQ